MKQRLNRFCAMLMIPFMLVLNCPVAAIGADPEVPTLDIEITHDPIEKATAGQRIMVEVEVENESGVEVVRAYFKAVEAMDYFFVPLEAAEDKKPYKGTLPAPANGVGNIDYLILVKTGDNQVVKTQTYRIAVQDDDKAAETVVNNEQIGVYTELQETPTEVTGFSDNIVIDVVESGAKLGVVAGIYSATAAGGSTSSAVGAGTVAASAGGISTTALVVGAVVAVAAVGGAAAAAGGGGSDGSDGGDGGGGGGGSGGSGSGSVTCQYSGSWRGQSNEISCDGRRYSGNWTGTVNSGCFFSGFDNSSGGSGGYLEGTINSSTGNAQLTGIYGNCGAINGSAVFNGNSVNGLYSGSGVSGNFSGVR